MNPSSTLIQVGKLLDVTSLKTGVQHDVLQKYAQTHAEYQARIQTQGHQEWDRRYHELRRLIPEVKATEICAESWPGQNEKDAAYEMYNSWRQSEGHWEAAMRKCRYWGYSMARGKNGVWYATGIIAS